LERRSEGDRAIGLVEQRPAADVKDDHGHDDQEQHFWLRATLIEALVGTVQSDRVEGEKAKAIAAAPEGWMAVTLQEQLDKLSKLLANAPI
jgi:hypothetical protein